MAFFNNTKDSDQPVDESPVYISYNNSEEIKIKEVLDWIKTNGDIETYNRYKNLFYRYQPQYQANFAGDFINATLINKNNSLFLRNNGSAILKDVYTQESSSIIMNYVSDAPGTIVKIREGSSKGRILTEFTISEMNWKKNGESYRKEIKANKAQRKLARKEILNRESKEQLAKLSELSLESKLEQLAYKKEKKNRSAALVSLEERFVCFEKDIKILKERRAKKSKKIQADVFKTSSFLNFKGETENLLSLFKDTYEGVPPAGAGECSAPRLLQSCYKLGFKPITFTEFWWGAPPKKQLRLHNTHYAACRGKCEPILSHMLQGISVQQSPLDIAQKDKPIETLYEDKDLLVVNKPHGLLSVPGKNIKQSVISVLKKEYSTTYDLYPVHRLDRQTSGVLLLAKNKKALAALQMQFEKRSTKKEYVALLDGILTQKEGTIVLPLATDYNDRPRQLVCFERGKYAETKFKLLALEKNTSRVRFYPQTGRSHQLRVHSAFHGGLNMAIVGDDLYGKHQDRMYLHAETLVFMHPKKNKELTVCAPSPF